MITILLAVVAGIALASIAGRLLADELFWRLGWVIIGYQAAGLGFWKLSDDALLNHNFTNDDVRQLAIAAVIVWFFVTVAVFIYCKFFAQSETD
ncbi:MAG: hypothetical protein ACM3IJ_00935 [Candidatus Levyibacteriota bacterium]